MKLKLVIISSLAFLLAFGKVGAQTQGPGSTYRRYFIGSSLFMLGNLVPDDANPPGFAQLSFGYRITPKDVISVEARTWKYAWPLGIPYGDSFESPAEKYPGNVRDFGIALTYQRFFWRGFYGSVSAMNAVQKYMDVNGKKTQSGYMLFMTYRVGYHIQLFKNRFFIEPSVAINHWPVRTNVPESFAAIDRRWPNYFCFEPGLNFGVKF
jgi:hypothetical protein